MINAAVHDKCRQELEAERQELVESIEDLSEDGMTTEEALETSALKDTLRATLTEVEHALSRLDNGTFGTCETCKQTISEERIAEVPAARLCVDCADARSSVITADRDVD